MASNFDFAAIRKESARFAISLGYKTNPNLPLLEVDNWKRSREEIADRTLLILVASAVSYGFPPKQAFAWVKDNNLLHAASTEERILLDGGFCDPSHKFRPEGTWVLGWVLGTARDFKLDKPVPNDAVFKFPDLRVPESAKAWKAKIKLMDAREAVAALDLYYCLHWAIQYSALRGKSPDGPLYAYSIIERRRALEWCFGIEDWDMISLDT